MLYALFDKLVMIIMGDRHSSTLFGDLLSGNKFLVGMAGNTTSFSIAVTEYLASRSGLLLARCNYWAPPEFWAVATLVGGFEDIFLPKTYGWDG